MTAPVIRYRTAPGRPLKRREIHGEYSCYTGKCRCTKCRAGSNRYAKRRELLKAIGAWRVWADPRPVRRHILSLRAAGLGRKTIAQLAGVAPSTVEAAAKKGRVRIRARVAKKILAVHPTLDNLPDWARIDATGTRRRLQALMVAGWSAQVLASRLEMDRNTIRKILLADVVRVSTARAVRNLFRVMWNRQPPSELRYERASVTRTRAYAARQGWAPAAAWDDIDNPKCRPKGVPRRETPLDTPAQTAA